MFNINELSHQPFRIVERIAKFWIAQHRPSQRYFRYLRHCAVRFLTFLIEVIQYQCYFSYDIINRLAILHVSLSQWFDSLVICWMDPVFKCFQTGKFSQNCLMDRLHGLQNQRKIMVSMQCRFNQKTKQILLVSNISKSSIDKSLSW